MHVFRGNWVVIILTSSLSGLRIQALIQLLNMNVNLAAEENFDCFPSKDRNSSSSTATHFSDDFIDQKDYQSEELLPTLTEIRWHMFENNSQAREISQKVSQRAVCWLMTVCWTRNLSDQCLWTTLLLFYHFKSQGKIRKEYLQQVLLTCLMIGSKLASSNPLTVKDLISLSSKKPSKMSIMELEGELLSSLNFDIIMHHYVAQLHHCCSISPQNIHRLYFICELLMVKDYKIFFDKGRLETLIQLVEAKDGWRNQQDFTKDIKQMLNFKDCQIIVKKYQSRFDVESFICLFQ